MVGTGVGTMGLLGARLYLNPKFVILTRQGPSP